MGRVAQALPAKKRHGLTIALFMLSLRGKAQAVKLLMLIIIRLPTDRAIRLLHKSVNTLLTMTLWFAKMVLDSSKVKQTPQPSREPTTPNKNTPPEPEQSGQVGRETNVQTYRSITRLAKDRDYCSVLLMRSKHQVRREMDRLPEVILYPPKIIYIYKRINGKVQEFIAYMAEPALPE